MCYGKAAGAGGGLYRRTGQEVDFTTSHRTHFLERVIQTTLDLAPCFLLLSPVLWRLPTFGLFRKSQHRGSGTGVVPNPVLPQRKKS
jgi:hypothetical protein